MTDVTLTYLSTLTYRADAKCGVSVLPLGTIFWDDEMPELQKVPAEDHDQVFLLFAIRSRIWDQVPLSADEKLLWDEARSKAPQWALFRRLRLSREEQSVRENAERDCAQLMDELFACADHVTISKGSLGSERVSATFRLTKERKAPRRRSWWSAITRTLKLWVRSRNL